MTTDNTIGGEGPSKGKACAHCGEHFGMTEFGSYMTKFWNNYVFCYVCQKNNYLKHSSNTLVFLGTGLFAILVAVVLFFGANIAFAMDTYSPIDGSFKISYVLLAGGAVAAITIAKFLMALFRWLTGHIQTDNLDYIDRKGRVEDHINQQY